MVEKVQLQKGSQGNVFSGEQNLQETFSTEGIIKTEDSLKKLSLIGNAHTDTVWLFSRRSTAPETRNTVDTADKLMEEFSEMKFVITAVDQLELIEKVDPSLFKRIQKRVSEGRMEIVGGMYSEADLHMPLETFAHQILYTQDYARNKFKEREKENGEFKLDENGNFVEVPYKIRHFVSLDQFGQPNYVEIVAKDFDDVTFNRGSEWETGKNAGFYLWVGVGGSKIIVGRVPFGYSSSPDDISGHINECAGEIDESIDIGMAFFGTGDTGGGPTRKNLEQLRKLRYVLSKNNVDLRFGGLDEVYGKIKELVSQGAIELPINTDDFDGHARGCYTDPEDKIPAAEAFNKLFKAEAANTMASMVIGWWDSQKNEVKAAAKPAMKMSHHDPISGTCLQSVHKKEVQPKFGETDSRAEDLIVEAGTALASHVDFEDKESSERNGRTVKTMLVINPAQEQTTIIEEEVGWLDSNKSYVVIGSGGVVAPSQIVPSEAAANGTNKIVFEAELPSFGWAGYKIMENEKKEEGTKMVADEHFIEADNYTLKIDQVSGGAQIFIKVEENGIKKEHPIFSLPSAVPVVMEDDSDTWGKFEVAFDKYKGQADKGPISLIRNGPLQSIIRVEYQYEDSIYIQDYYVDKRSNAVKVKGYLDYRGKREMVKLKFFSNLRDMRVTAGRPGSWADIRATGQEEPFTRWVDMEGTIGKGKKYGFSLITKGDIQGFSTNVRSSTNEDGNTITLSLDRSPNYANHTPKKIPPDSIYPFKGQGIYEFEYEIYLHEGSWREAETMKKAELHSKEPIVMPNAYNYLLYKREEKDKKPLPMRQSLVEVEKGHIAITCLKVAEDGHERETDDLILRFQACPTSQFKKRNEAVINLPTLDRRIRVQFREGEIVTLRIPRDPNLPFFVTNIAEDILENNT